MLFNNLEVAKNRKVLLPFFNVRELKPIASLLSPMNLIIPMVFIVLIAQITDNLKGVLNPKEIQKIPSVKVYSRVLSIGLNSVTLSFIISISKTLGPELEVLSLLDVPQRINFLKNLLTKIILEKGPCKISNKSSVFFDSFDLLKHRRGLALQFRSTLIASPIFSPHNIVLGIPINQIDLNTILESCRLIWLMLGLEIEEFDFLLRKESLIVFKNLKESYCNFPLIEPKNSYDSLRLLVYFEMRNVLGFSDFYVFHDDLIVLKGDSNLTLLEKEFMFFKRPIPDLPSEVFVSDYQLKDILVRAAVDQRKNQRIKIQNVFKRVGKNLYKKKG